MANLPETSTFDPGVYQIETTDPVLGGPNGVTNTPLRALTNRTRYLKTRVDGLEAGTFVPPGIATEAFVTGAINRQDIKSSVRAATTGTITLSGLQSVDGVSLTAGDRVLVKDQEAGQQNGIYLAASGTWTRATDADGNDEVTAGLLVLVTNGATQADTIWKLKTNDPIQLGTTLLVFGNITEGFAPLASPSFTGTPTAPTQAAASNGTALATTEFVQRRRGGQMAMTINPGTNLITLTAEDIGYATLRFFGEPSENVTVLIPPTPMGQYVVRNSTTTGFSLIVRATGAGTVTSEIPPNTSLHIFTDGLNVIPASSVTTVAGKRGNVTLVVDDVAGAAPLESPVFTGNPTAPTAALGDNDTSVATTAFVQRALGNLQSATTFTGNMVLTAADAGKAYIYGEPANATITLPSFASTVVGASFLFINTGPNTLTVQRAGSDQIDSGLTTVNSIAVGPGQSLEILRATATLLWHVVTATAASAPTETPPQFDNDTSTATTAFVQRALGNHQGAETFTVSMAIAAADAGRVFVYTGAGAATATLPLIADVPSGAALEFINTGTGTLTVSRAGTDLIDTGPSSASTVSVPPNQSLKLIRATGSSLWQVGSIPAPTVSGLFQSQLATSGYQRLPGGMILQWGRDTDSATAKSFPIAFPTACLNMTASEDLLSAGAASAQNGAAVFIVSNSQFRVAVGVQDGAQTVYWQAIGY